MLSFLFTAIFALFFISPPPSSALSLEDLKLISKVARTPVAKLDTKKTHLPKHCNNACSFLRVNASTGGDCFTLLLTTPTCLQCLVLPRHHNDTLLATALTALDHCQNGTTAFPAINITRSEAPKIIEGFFGNGTLGLNSTERHVNRTKERKGVQNAVVWNPCPTTLFFPEMTSGGRRLGGNLVVVFVGFVGVWGFVNGLGL